MGFGLRRTVDSATEAVTTAEAVAWLRTDSGVETAIIDSLTAAARRWCEKFTQRSFTTQTWQLTLDCFPSCDEIALPYAAPLQSVESVQYYDQSGALQTLSTSMYQTDTNSEPGRIALVYGQSWPVTAAGKVSAVIITYVAGYSDDGEDVPDEIKTAIKQLLAHWYEHRGPTVEGITLTPVPMMIQYILWPLKVSPL